MAHYHAQGRLYLSDTRDQAAERAVQDWARLTDTKADIRDVALIADASNAEIDRLNARAQHLRARRGELGSADLPLSNRHYGLREGDLITFTAQHRPPGGARVENGARGEITHFNEHDRALTVTLDGSRHARPPSPAKTQTSCASPTPSTSTVNRARPSIAPSS